MGQGLRVRRLASTVVRVKTEDAEMIFRNHRVCASTLIRGSKGGGQSDEMV